MAWQGLKQSINIGSTSRFIKLNLRFFVHQTQTCQGKARYTTKLSTNNQIFISGKQLPQVWENFTLYFRKAV